MRDFIIGTTDLSFQISKKLDLIVTTHKYHLWGDKDQFKRRNNITIFIDGYILPRHEVINELSDYNQFDLILQLYSKYNKEFINYLKGNFIIIVADNNGIQIFNDRNSIYKFYIYKSPGEIIISNNIFLISNLVKIVLNPVFPAIQALFQHAVSGITIFKNVQYSEFATRIILHNEIVVERYWEPNFLINTDKDRYSKNELINLFKEVINDYIQYFNPQKVSLTLTGGRDTRSVLAALLSLEKIPHCFTFGDPEGTDVTTAKNICSKIKIPFANHYIENITKKIYEKLSLEIVSVGNPLIHIHRAHRLDAIKKESELTNGIDMLFAGAMGGDFIKGVSFNDYIVSEFIRLYFFDNKSIVDKIKYILNKHYIKYSDDTVEELIEIIKNIDWLDKDNFKKSEFLIAHSFIGSLHDSQDLYLFSKYSSHVVMPFMDLDIFEALFQSRYSLFNNFRSSKNPLKKIQGGEFQASLIKKLFRPLAYLPMANKYTPNDLLTNRYFYLFKRLLIELTKGKTIPTFSYDNWFTEFVQINFNNLPEEVVNSYKTVELLKDLENSSHKKFEGYWHRFSNPIMVSLWLKKINNN